MCMLLVDVMDTGQDLEGTGLNVPIPGPTPAALPDVTENILLIEEPEPSSNIPPQPQVAPPAPGQQIVQQDEPPPPAIAEELTSKYPLNFFYIFF